MKRGEERKLHCKTQNFHFLLLLPPLLFLLKNCPTKVSSNEQFAFCLFFDVARQPCLTASVHFKHPPSPHPPTPQKKKSFVLNTFWEFFSQENYKLLKDMSILFVFLDRNFLLLLLSKFEKKRNFCFCLACVLLLLLWPMLSCSLRWWWRWQT